MDYDIDRNIIIKAILKKINEESRPSKIEVKDYRDYESPLKIEVQEDSESFVPDLLVHFDKTINVYELELEENRSVEKWNALADYAKKNSGHLFIVAPEYLKENIKKKITENGFNAGLLYFRT